MQQYLTSMPNSLSLQLRDNSFYVLAIGNTKQSHGNSGDSSTRVRQEGTLTLWIEDSLPPQPIPPRPQVLKSGGRMLFATFCHERQSICAGGLTSSKFQRPRSSRIRGQRTEPKWGAPISCRQLTGDELGDRATKWGPNPDLVNRAVQRALSTPTCSR